MMQPGSPPVAGLWGLASRAALGGATIIIGCAGQTPAAPPAIPDPADSLSEYRVFYNPTDEFLEFDVVGMDGDGSELKFGGDLIVDLYLAEVRSAYAGCPSPPKVDRQVLAFVASDFVQVAIPYRGAAEDHLAARLFLDVPSPKSDDCHGPVRGGQILKVNVWLMAGPFGGNDPPLTFED